MNSTDKTDTGTLQEWDNLSFRLLSVQMLKGSGEVKLAQQLNFSYALIVVTGGAVRVNVDRRQYELAAGSFCLGLPDQTIGTAEPAASLELFIFYFEVYRYGGSGGAVPRLVKDAVLFSNDQVLSSVPSRLISSICNGIIHGPDDGGQTISFRVQIDFQELLYHIRMYSSRQQRDTATALEQARQYIEAHYPEPLTIHQLALAAEFSPKYFVDLFKKKYGKSALEYAAELRLQEAKRLMAESGLRLREIAHRVGYADEFYFSRKFKKAIGVAPAVYMKSRRRKLAAYTPALLGQLLPLNITPYAAALHPKWTEYYYRNYRGEIPVHISAYRNNQEWQANLELLRQHKLDLIITGAPLEEEEKHALEQIAPVHHLSVSNDDWRGQFNELAQYLGETWQGDQWLAAYEQEVKSSRAQLHEQLQDESVVVIRMLGSRLYLHCTRGMACTLYHELGLKPAYDSGMETYNVPVTPAEIAALQADHLLMLIRRENETLGEWERLQNHHMWLQIPAVQRHRVHFLNSDPWREESAYAQLRMLRQTMQLFTANRP